MVIPAGHNPIPRGLILARLTKTLEERMAPPPPREKGGSRRTTSPLTERERREKSNLTLIKGGRESRKKETDATQSETGGRERH